MALGAVSIPRGAARAGGFGADRGGGPGHRPARLGVDVVELGGDHQAVHERGALAAAVTAGEHPCPPPQSHTAQRSFSGIVGQAETAIRQKPGEPVPSGQHIIQRLGHGGMAGHCRALLAHPVFQFIDQRLGLLLPGWPAFHRWWNWTCPGKVESQFLAVRRRPRTR